MKIYKLINLFEKYFGYKFFKNYNIFSYNFFDIFLKNKIKKNIKNDFIKNFINEGYNVLELDSSNFVEKLNLELQNQNLSPNEKMFCNFEFNERIKIIIKQYLENDFKKHLVDLKNYYNCDIFVSNIKLKRNYFFEKANDIELYNNFYHNDAYIFTHFKLFVNLMDMTEDMGPTHVFSINDTKKIVKMSKSFVRNDNIENLDSKIKPYKHTGPKGKSFLCLTSKCLHKAGVPSENKHRDYLIITFVANPKIKSTDLFHFENEFENSIWNGDAALTTKLAKPYGYKKLYNFYQSFK